MPQIISNEAWDNARNDWINNHIRSSPLTQSTEAWNYLNGTALPKFRELLERELQPKGEPVVGQE